MYFVVFFFFNDTATTEIYTLSDTLSLHDALPISRRSHRHPEGEPQPVRQHVRSEEHTSELQSPLNISYAVFCLKKKKKPQRHKHNKIFSIQKQHKKKKKKN